MFFSRANFQITTSSHGPEREERVILQFLNLDLELALLAIEKRGGAGS